MWDLFTGWNAAAIAAGTEYDVPIEIEGNIDG